MKIATETAEPIREGRLSHGQRETTILCFALFELDEKLREWRSNSFQSSVRCRRDYEPKFGAKRRCGGGPKFSAMSFDDTSAN